MRLRLTTSGRDQDALPFQQNGAAHQMAHGSFQFAGNHHLVREGASICSVRELPVRSLTEKALEFPAKTWLIIP
jgi:hypothetical protein